MWICFVTNFLSPPCHLAGYKINTGNIDLQPEPQNGSIVQNKFFRGYTHCGWYWSQSHSHSSAQLTNHTGTIHTVPGTQRHSSPILPSVSERHIAVLRLTCISKCMKKLRRQHVRAEFASTESFSRTVSSAKAPCCARTCGTKTDAPYANVSTIAATYWLIW